MKKVLLIIVLALVAIGASACDSRPVLNILNWGEYINEEVVRNFEDEYGINVKISVADSNELFYSKIKSGTTSFDLVIPSDYMIEKMYEEDMLHALDYSKLPNYDDVTYMDGVEQIFDSMAETTLARNGKTVDYKDYMVPYFWGTFGIIYNNRVSGLKEALNQYGWAAYFDATTHFPNARRGMYDVAQFAYAAAMLYRDQNPNDYSAAYLNQVKLDLQTANFTQWGDDMLKRDIEADNLDMAFTYTGDYLDRLYIQLDEGKSLEQVRADFDIYIPENTLVFIDGMVIPKTAKNIDGAHQFINYLLDPEVVALNSEVVGYATALEEAYDIIVSYQTSTDDWYKNWALANLTYYNKDREGSFYPMTTLSASAIDSITSMVQQVVTG
jgi:spermidine/putrescine-binding protein